MKDVMSLRGVVALCTVMLVVLAPGARAADDFPNRPLRMVVGFSAGGATDVTARLVAQHLGERLGQTVVVENRPGAGGSIAAGQVAKATPDGYTLLYTSAAHAINAALYKKLSFDPVADFVPLSTTATTLNALIVNPSVPARTVADFIKHSKTHPGTIHMASTGVGSSSHMSQLHFTSMAGIKVSHIPYKGTNEIVRAIIAGEVTATLDAVTAYLPYLKTGALIALCVGDTTRGALLPDVPTCDVSGLPGYAVRSWQGVLTSANVPKPVVDRLSREINATLRMPAVVQQMQAAGARPLGSTPTEFQTLIKQDIGMFSKLVNLAGINRQ